MCVRERERERERTRWISEGLNLNLSPNLSLNFKRIIDPGRVQRNPEAYRKSQGKSVFVRRENR